MEIASAMVTSTMGPASNSSASSQSHAISNNERDILAAHATSGSQALIYIVVVLLVYALALVLLMMKYVKRERDEARLSYIYDEFVRRDRRMRGNKSPEVVHVSAISPATCNPDPQPERFLVLQNVTPV